ncbi:MAG: hypothetical protein JNK04_14785, partial [Myxococcales bacterium]|nr:hypothetical protein [Myxococcales bacterium]
FCDGFETASPGGNGGDLDERRWSVARISNGVNVPQGNLSDWPPATAEACGATTPGLLPGADLFFCTNPESGVQQLNDTFDNFGSPAFHSLRVRQPIDFADRTATIALDLDAKQRTPGGKGWWWALVVSEEPVPAPYRDFISHFTMPRRALVLDMNGFDCTGGDGTQNQLSAVLVYDDYQVAEELVHDDLLDLQCFATAEEMLNHVEVRFSQTRAELWATDGDAAETLRLVGRVEGLSLPFTRGYVSIVHAQYNGEAVGLPSSMTYHFGSLGFDGPVLPTPRAYEIPFSNTSAGNAPADHVNIGYLASATGLETCCEQTPLPSLSLTGVDLADASAARLNLDAYGFVAGGILEHRWNGGAWRAFAHPFPDSNAGARALTIPVVFDDLVPGDNMLELRATDDTTIVNLELEIE